MKIPPQVLASLLQDVKLETPSPYDPVVVRYTPSPWELVGTGNYAGVFGHPDYPDLVVKLYAPGREGIEAEREVYRKLGETEVFPACYQEGENYLVIKRMKGISLFDCFRYGIPIPPEVIEQVDGALDFARQKGLYPQDVHGKNVLMNQGKAYIVDVSDYLNEKYDTKWEDLCKAYYKLYQPFIKDRRIKIPLFALNGLRKVYRLYKMLKRQIKKRKG